MLKSLVLSEAGIDGENRSAPGHPAPINAPQGAVAAPVPGTLPVIGRMAGAARATGLALCVEPDGEEEREDRFALWIVDAEGHPALRLGGFREEDVVAEWRRLAAEGGLTLMLVDETGRLVVAQPQIGRVRLGAVRIRRGHGLLAGRRPRFLLRRKTTRLAQHPLVHRGERVIASNPRG